MPTVDKPFLKATNKKVLGRSVYTTFHAAEQFVSRVPWSEPPFDYYMERISRMGKRAFVRKKYNGEFCAEIDGVGFCFKLDGPYAVLVTVTDGLSLSTKLALAFGGTR